MAIATAVCRPVADSASDRELEATLEQLPNSFRRLFADGEPDDR